MLNRTMIKETALQGAQAVSREIVSLPDPNTPNYKVAMAASATLCLISLAARLEDGQFTSYLALGSFLMSSGMAVNQYGLEKSRQLVTNTAATLFSSVKTAIQNKLNPQPEVTPELRTRNKLS